MDFKVEVNEYLPLRDVVFNTLRQAILTGELKPGERLMEIHLANRLGVSRTPIREAIRKLELEGLVIMVPRKGAEVAKITEKSMRDVLEVRKALEELAVCLACKRITDDKVEELREALEDFQKVVQTRNVTKITEADVHFHNIIFEVTNNQRLIHIIHNLGEQMYRYRLEYIKEEKYHGKIVKEHEAILEAIRRRDIESAVNSVSIHINNQEESILRSIKE